MAWTVGSAQHDVDQDVQVPFFRRTYVRVYAAGLVAAGLLTAAGQSWALWIWGIAFGAGLAFRGYRDLEKTKPPVGGPCFAIDTITSEGPIELVGRIVPPKRALLSPLTSCKCVYFDYKVTELDESDQPTNTLDANQKLCDFWLKDITGKIWVASEDIEIDYKPQLDSDLRVYDQMPRAVRERFQKIEFDPFLSPGVRKPVHLWEKRLDPGDNVLVKGTVTRGEEGKLQIAKGAGALTIERFTGEVFVPLPAEGPKRQLAAGGAIAALSLILLFVL